jgi:hypothetical protein
MQMKPAVLLVAFGLLVAGSTRADEEFSQEDVRAAVQAHVDAKVRQEGAFRYKDQQADAVLDLEQDRIRMVRRIHGYGYFVDVDFHAKGEPLKPYDLDFWLKEGKLEIVDVRIHKGPKRDGDAWKLVTRNPVPWCP